MKKNVEYCMQYFNDFSSEALGNTIALFNIIKLENKFSIDEFSFYLIEYLINEREDFFDCSYDTIKKFNIPMRYFAVRNLCLELEIIKRNKDDSFSFNDYENVEKMSIKKRRTVSQQTLEELYKELSKQEELGELAERYVLNIERHRYPNKNVEYISPINTKAGYDIRSFFSKKEKLPTKMIEVKCVGDNYSFFISKNEIEKATQFPNEYYLYLVHYSLTQKPIEICNVISYIESNGVLSPQSYKVTWQSEKIELIGEKNVIQSS
ncbi:DUF3883 domain-containing protein [Enterococcus sp. DIV1406a]